MPAISYVPMDQMDDEMRVEMERMRTRRHAPSGELAPSAHTCPDVVQDVHRLLGRDLPPGRPRPLHQGALPLYIITHHELSSSAATSAHQVSAGLPEYEVDDLLNFETSDQYDDRQKAALAYAQAIAWGEQDLDGLWARLHAHFTEPSWSSSAASSPSPSASSPGSACSGSATRSTPWRASTPPPGWRRAWPG